MRMVSQFVAGEDGCPGVGGTTAPVLLTSSTSMWTANAGRREGYPPIGRDPTQASALFDIETMLEY